MSSTLVVMRFDTPLEGEYTCVASNVFRMKKKSITITGEAITITGEVITSTGEAITIIGEAIIPSLVGLPVQLRQLPV